MKLGALRQHVRQDGRAKQCLATKAAALEAMRSWPITVGRTTRAYECNVCGDWHVGHVR